MLGSVLSVERWPASEAAPGPGRRPDFVTTNRRLEIKSLPALVLVQPARCPDLPHGNASWTHMLNTPQGNFALFVGHMDPAEGTWGAFEVWERWTAPRTGCRGQDPVDGHARQ